MTMKKQDTFSLILKVFSPHICRSHQLNLPQLCLRNLYRKVSSKIRVLYIKQNHTASNKRTQTAKPQNCCKSFNGDSEKSWSLFDSQTYGALEKSNYYYYHVQKKKKKEQEIRNKNVDT